jgi:hypothetical protein
MIKIVTAIALTCASTYGQVAVQPPSTTAESANRVIEWNRNVLALVRTRGTYPAVDAIDATHDAFILQVSGTLPGASQGAANPAASHELLVSPSLRVTRTALLHAGQFSAGPRYWNEIIHTGTVPHQMTTAQDGRLKGPLANGVDAFYDAKYTSNFWRPVTATRAGLTRNDPDTDNLTWLPEAGNTGSTLSYPGAPGAIVVFSFHPRLATLLRRIYTEPALYIKNR